MMLRSTARVAVAALRSGSKGAVFGNKAVSPRGALLSGAEALVLSGMGSRRLSFSGGRGSDPKQPMNPTKLLHDVMACTDVRGILGMVQQHGKNFESGHVGVAWGKMTQMPSGEGGGDEAELLKLLQVLTSAKMHEWEGPQLGNVVHSIATLCSGGRMVVGEKLGRELQARARETSGEMMPQDLAMFSYGLASMSIKIDVGVVLAMQRRALDTAFDFSPQEIAMFMLALEMMETTAEPGMLAALQVRRETPESEGSFAYGIA